MQAYGSHLQMGKLRHTEGGTLPVSHTSVWKAGCGLQVFSFHSRAQSSVFTSLCRVRARSPSWDNRLIVCDNLEAWAWKSEGTISQPPSRHETGWVCKLPPQTSSIPVFSFSLNCL